VGRLIKLGCNPPDGDCVEEPAFTLDAKGGLYGKYFKRLFDIAFIVAALPAIAIILAVLAPLVRRDGGPVFYVQDRIGRDGRVFHLWKIRTMEVDADQKLARYLIARPEARIEWMANQKLKNDPRVTRLGQILRRTSLDELPQCWNVLRGDMSLVGPRPMMLNQQAIYPGDAYYKLRPGLTGLWQVSERNETSFARRAVFDSQYASQLSFATDLGVLLRTLLVMLRATGC
jgi:exopolysaccharide production protein ExoY